MKKSGSGRIQGILALAALLLLSGPGLKRARAAEGIDTGRMCSLTVSVEVSAAGAENETYREDLEQMSIPVAVYRVADVDMTGLRYMPTDVFAELDFGKIETDSGHVTAADWEEWSAQAEAVRQEKKPEADRTAVIEKAGTGGGYAQAVIGELTPGLYLVVPEASYNPEYTARYTFLPYLAALPGSVYAWTGEGSDEWIYDVVIGLKPEAEPLFGRLHITKNLRNYNAALGPATFVFHIAGVDENGTVRYEEVESMTYTEAGSRTITLEGIPAGLAVTVTEVYSGASYRVEGSGVEVTEIRSEEAAGAGAEEAAVSFENDYDGGNRGGYGVTNHFASDGAGGWLWENPTLPGN